ncbi:MAG: carboxypeptidase-like regulatory domain-containing protein, partial [Tannerellaceae bacterium]|nr:carboxypeptidase-like regulatory domain-containing protein [Tannerellaceae bacterium]
MTTGKSFLLAILLLIINPVHAITVRGRVTEQATGLPIEQAAVRLLSSPDSAFVKGMATSKEGRFRFTAVTPGDYLLQVTFLGYQTFHKPVKVTGQNTTINIGTLPLSEEAIALDEALVIGKAPEVTVRNDTMEYNADSYKIGEGQVLEDLLKKMPGVEISDEGKITVNGKEVKRVMVEGKEFFSSDPKVASKNLPSNMVDKVQVLDRLSDMARMTGFNDGDEETVINLTVKPGMKEGWFGNAFAGYGSDQRYEGNGMVNRFTGDNQITVMGSINNTNNMGFSDLASTMFQGMGEGRRRMWQGGGNGITESGNIGGNINRVVRPDKLEINGNARYAHSDNLLQGRTSRQNILANDSLSYETEADTSRSRSENIGANLRIDWHPNEATQIVFRPDFGYSCTEKSEQGETTTLDGVHDTVNLGSQRSYQSGEGYNASFQIDFSRKLNDKGRVLSGTLQGGINDSYSDGTNYSKIDYLLTDKETLLDQHIRYDNSSYNYRIFVSFVEPIGQNNFLQATYTYRHQQQEALKNAYDRDPDGNYTVQDTTQSKNYLNTFITQRISLGFKAVREKYNYTVGFNVDPF